MFSRVDSPRSFLFYGSLLLFAAGAGVFCAADGPSRPRTRAEQEAGKLSLRVAVIDENEAPVAGAQIKLGATGARTNAAGVALLDPIPAGLNVLHVKHRSFAETARRIKINAGERTFATVRLLRIREQRVNLARTLRIKRPGFALEVPAGTMVDAAGRPAREAILRYRLLDSRREAAAMPGAYIGRLADGSEKNLETFGAISLTFLSIKNGEELQVRAGRVLDLRMRAQAPIEGGEIPIWSLDTERGIWVDEGTAPVETGPGGQEIALKLPHLSWWNCDIPYIVTTIWIKSFQNAKGEYLFTPEFTATGLDYRGISPSMQTAPLLGVKGKDRPLPGRCVQVKRNSTVKLEAFFVEGRNQYDLRREIKTKDVTADCYANPQDGVVIDVLELKPVATACVRGRLSLSGAGRGPFPANLMHVQPGGRMQPISRAIIPTYGEFCLDDVPVNHDAFLVVEDTRAVSFEACDRARTANVPIRARRPTKNGNCKHNREACLDLGRIRGRITTTFCSPRPGETIL